MNALSHLDGVKSAKMGDKKTKYVVEVLETKSILPSDIRKAVEERFSILGVTMEATGTLSKDGEAWIFTQRASNQKFGVVPNDDLAKLAKDGKMTVLVTGKVTEAAEKDGKKPLPQIEVTAAKEAKVEEKKEEKK